MPKKKVSSIRHSQCCNGRPFRTVVMKRGEIWWATLPDPRASEPGYRRPVLIVQSDAFNQSAIRTVIVVAITSNLRLAAAPGNVMLRKRDSRYRRGCQNAQPPASAIDQPRRFHRLHRPNRDAANGIETSRPRESHLACFWHKGETPPCPGFPD